MFKVTKYLFDMFQSTPSKRKETIILQIRKHMLDVSIHSFQAEGDNYIVRRECMQVCFNPLLPSGRRHNYDIFRNALMCFNPLLPSGRRHRKEKTKMSKINVSIHSFQAEGDNAISVQVRTTQRVSIHSFQAEGDKGVINMNATISVSIHSFQAEGDA